VGAAAPIEILKFFTEQCKTVQNSVATVYITRPCTPPPLIRSSSAPTLSPDVVSVLETILSLADLSKPMFHEEK
jgi:hypothetical protein